MSRTCVLDAKLCLAVFIISLFFISSVWGAGMTAEEKYNISMVDTLLADWIGIGVLNPTAKLDVSGTVKATSFVGDGSGLTGIDTGEWDDAAGGISYTDGNVGIGTASPDRKLDVLDASNPQMRLTQADNSYADFQMTTNGHLVMNVDGQSNQLVLANDGDIGIGIAGDPKAKLAVSGGMSVGANYNMAPPSNGMIIQGNVGIGTTSPEKELHVIGDIRNTGTAWLANNYVVATSSSLWLMDNLELALGNGKDYSLGYAVGDDSFRIVDGSDLGSSVRMLIDSSGNVGIGTTSPGIYKLKVSGTIHSTNYIFADGGFVFGGSAGEGELLYRSGNDIYIRAGNTDRMLIDGDNGNVGIGTTTPTEKLDVSGTVKATSFVGDGSGLTGIEAGKWDDATGGISYTGGNVEIGTTITAYPGDYDLLIGEYDGATYCYKNTGSVSSPVWTRNSAWDVPDVGSTSKPAFADLDKDGDYDLLIGSSAGATYCYKNTGSASSPVWTRNSAWDLGDVGNHAAPAFADL
ncbi:MAG: hypothetical protein U9P44_01165, partial [archaeon]|nr:hypothetical protein [archaeon]